MISEMCEWEAAAADDDDLKTATINSKYQSFVGARWRWSLTTGGSQFEARWYHFPQPREAKLTDLRKHCFFETILEAMIDIDINVSLINDIYRYRYRYSYQLIVNDIDTEYLSETKN